MVERVQKHIAQAGYCSRRKAEELIGEGRVKVNNKLISLGDKCSEEDEVRIDNKIISLEKPQCQYVLMNKPKGVVTTNSDEMDRKTVFDILPDNLKEYRLFSVGRLDKETTGLLLLTNDGNLSQKIIHPSSKIPKIYHVTLDKKLQEQDKKTLEKGIHLEGYKLAPCVIKNHKTYYVVKIWEGRKRQIRRMFEEKEYQVKELERVRIGNLDLYKLNLKPGQVKKVKKEFLEKTILNI